MPSEPDAHGEYGNEIRAMELPETLVDICRRLPDFHNEF